MNGLPAHCGSQHPAQSLYLLGELLHHIRHRQFLGGLLKRLSENALEECLTFAHRHGLPPEDEVVVGPRLQFEGEGDATVTHTSAPINKA